MSDEEIRNLPMSVLSVPTRVKVVFPSRHPFRTFNNPKLFKTSFFFSPPKIFTREKLRESRSFFRNNLRSSWKFLLLARTKDPNNKERTVYGDRSTCFSILVYTSLRLFILQGNEIVYVKRCFRLRSPELRRVASAVTRNEYSPPKTFISRHRVRAAGRALSETRARQPRQMRRRTSVNLVASGWRGAGNREMRRGIRVYSK